jgi:hypothetical protein
LFCIGKKIQVIDAKTWHFSTHTFFKAQDIWSPIKPDAYAKTILKFPSDNDAFGLPKI